MSKEQIIKKSDLISLFKEEISLKDFFNKAKNIIGLSGEMKRSARSISSFLDSILNNKGSINEGNVEEVWKILNKVKDDLLEIEELVEQAHTELQGGKKKKAAGK
ncbi:MAG: hypothetical protein ACREQ5_37315 [Candidatus Dormibacteria bacterium]